MTIATYLLYQYQYALNANNQRKCEMVGINSLKDRPEAGAMHAPQMDCKMIILLALKFFI